MTENHTVVRMPDNTPPFPFSTPRTFKSTRRPTLNPHGWNLFKIGLVGEFIYLLSSSKPCVSVYCIFLFIIDKMILR